LEQSWHTAMRQKMKEPNKGKQPPGVEPGRKLRI
jgi:hypothetical protein